MSECINCGHNPGEVCRGCCEQAKREAYAWGGERIDVAKAATEAVFGDYANMLERAVEAECERDRLRKLLPSEETP